MQTHEEGKYQGADVVGVVLTIIKCYVFTKEAKAAAISVFK